MHARAPEAEDRAFPRPIQPRPGDRGVYVVSLIELSRGEARILEAERPWFSFEWRPPQYLRDAAGTLRLANGLRVAPAPDTAAAVALPLPDATWWFDHATGEPVVERRRLERGEPALTPDGGWSPSVQYTRFVGEGRPGTAADQPPCGLRPPPLEPPTPSSVGRPGFAGCRLGGVHVPIREDAASLNFRRWPAPDSSGAGERWEASPKAPAASGRVIVDALPGIPAPALVAVESTQRPGLFEVARLARFEAGSALDPPLPPDLPDLPPLEWRAGKPWGPDDDRVDHPFPLGAGAQLTPVANETNHLPQSL